MYLKIRKSEIGSKEMDVSGLAALQYRRSDRGPVLAGFKSTYPGRTKLSWKTCGFLLACLADHETSLQNPGCLGNRGCWAFVRWILPIHKIKGVLSTHSVLARLQWATGCPAVGCTSVVRSAGFWGQGYRPDVPHSCLCSDGDPWGGSLYICGYLIGSQG